MKAIKKISAKFILPGILIMLTLQLSAQDPHLSQYDVSAIMLNPSYTGMISREDLRAVIQHRSQWGSLGSKFMSTSLAFDAPIDKQFGAGLYFSDDEAARTFGAISLVVAGAYQITSPSQRKYKLCVGLAAGFIYKKTKDSELLFNNQYDNGNFDPDILSGEKVYKNSAWMPEVSLGFSYIHIDDKKNFNPYAGLSVFHLTNPKESFYGDKESRLPMRFTLHGGTKIYIKERTELNPNLLLMKQSNNYALLICLNGKYKVIPKLAIAAGLYYRLGDAIIPMIGFDYKNYIFRISYDITVSPLRKYTNYQGGLEFSLQFTGAANKAKFTRF